MTTFLKTPGGRIAFDRAGDGPPVILVGGAFQFRAFDTETQSLAAELGQRGLTAINYDRPGRGESEFSAPYTLQGEIDVLRALTDELGPAVLYGSSSGSSISLAAAAAGVPVTRLILWEAPIGGDDAQDGALDLIGMREKLAAGDPAEAVRFFMRDMPVEMRAGVEQSPAWPVMCAMAGSLEPDVESIAWSQSGPSRRELWASITVPVLVLLGAETMPFFPPAADSIVAALEDARQERVAGAGHRWELDAMASVIADFAR